MILPWPILTDFSPSTILLLQKNCTLPLPATSTFGVYVRRLSARPDKQFSVRCIDQDDLHILGTAALGHDEFGIFIDALRMTAG